MEQIPVEKLNYITFIENGKHGLKNYSGKVLLNPIFDSLEITNEDIDLHYLLAKNPGDRDFDDQGVGLHNCQIIKADDKQRRRFNQPQ